MASYRGHLAFVYRRAAGYAPRPARGHPTGAGRAKR